MANRPILETLREIRRGALLDDCAQALADVVSRVSQTGKPGSFTLKLTVKPAGRGSVRTVVLEDDVSTKLPGADKEVTIFFPTEDGGLSRSDPAQIPLALRGVETIDRSTGEIHVAS